ncbi:MAG: hypothetical protein QM764_21675 [Chitinophagaceae bacterium]
MHSKARVKVFCISLLLFGFFQSDAQDSTAVKNLPPVTVTASLRKIPNRVWKGFSTYFSEAENPRWFRLNRNFLVKFMIYDEENRAVFTKRGTLIYHISYGYEKSLPASLLQQLNASYEGFSVLRAVKVTDNARTIWVVTLEAPTTLLLVKAEEDELEEVNRFTRSD